MESQDAGHQIAPSFKVSILALFFLLLLVVVIVFLVLNRTNNKSYQSTGTAVHKFTQADLNIALQKGTAKSAVSLLSPEEEKANYKNLTAPLKKSLKK